MLHTEGLVKRFRSIVAVDKVTMYISAGQMVGIIGCSGALGRNCTLMPILLSVSLIDQLSKTIRRRFI
jgi:ABC-type Na+ transport system ATPase subunit NatA